MEIEFNGEHLLDLYIGKKIPGKPQFDKIVIKAFIKAIDKLKAANKTEDLYQLHSLNFEALQGSNLYSVRVNDKYRIEFTKRDENSITILTIIKLSNHYK